MKILQKINQYKADAGGFKNLFFHTALAITFTSGLSYMLGLIRDKSFAYTFGASSTLDVYNAAFVVPDLFLATLVNGALSAAFIPIFANLEKHHKQKALEYINQVLSFGMSILIAASVLFAIFLPYLVEFIVPGFSAAQQDQYITVTRLMLISPLLFTISNTFGNVLISTKDFLWYGLSPVFYNLGIIIGVFLFVPSFGIMGLVMGTVLGAFLHLMVRLPVVIRYGYRPKLTFKLEGELKKTATLMLPKMLQLGMWQIMLWWFIRLASHLEEGSVTIYSFARNFQSLPVSLIGVAIALAAFAKLSHVAAERDFTAFKAIVREKTWVILGTTTLAAIALALISHPLIQILLGGGKFDETAVLATASLLAVYTLSIPFESLMHFLSRAHYALQNTMRASMIHVGTIVLTLVLSQSLVERFGLYAIPMGFTTGLVLHILILEVSLRQLVGKLSAAK